MAAPWHAVLGVTDPVSILFVTILLSTQALDRYDDRVVVKLFGMHLSSNEQLHQGIT